MNQKSLKVLGIVLAALMLTSGCARLPLDGQLKVGPDIQGGLASDYIYYSPGGPTVGASQKDIVTGFITAGTGPQNDYATAREFLSEDLKSVWSPNDEVLLQQSKGILQDGETNHLTYSFNLAASVSAEGQYSAANAGTAQNLDFELVKERGQWRISKAPNLTVLIRPVFEVIFKSYSIYFYDHQRRYLVPELRWFPSRASTGTRLVNAVLDGPSDWLSPAVETAVPKSTQLALDAVTIERGTAVVDLTSQALKANTLQRQLLKAQLVATLEQLSSVSFIEIRIDHSPQEIADFNVPQPPSASYTPVALAGSKLFHLSPEAQTEVSGSRAFVEELSPTDFSLSSDERRLALLNNTGLHLSALNQVAADAELVDGRAGLLSPSFDLQGYLWSLTKLGPSALLAVRSDGSAINVSDDWLSSRTRMQFALSPEGSRIAILVSGDGKNRLEVASVIRDKRGQPIGISEPIVIASEIISPESVSWVDSLTLAVLSKDDLENSRTPYFVTVGGSVSKIGVLTDAKQLVASNPTSSVFALSKQGSLYRYRSFNWVLIREAVSAIHFTN